MDVSSFFFSVGAGSGRLTGRDGCGVEVVVVVEVVEPPPSPVNSCSRMLDVWGRLSTFTIDWCASLGRRGDVWFTLDGLMLMIRVPDSGVPGVICNRRTN